MHNEQQPSTQPFSIANHLRLAAVFCFISLVMYFLIPRDPKNALFLGFSASRLGIMLGIIAIMITAITATGFLRRRPADERRLSSAISSTLSKDILMKAIWLVSVLIFVISFYYVASFLITTDDQYKQLLLRLLPVVFLVFAFTMQLLTAMPKQSAAGIAYWKVFLVALVTLGIGWLLQTFLLAQANRPKAISIEFVLVSLGAYLVFSLLLYYQLFALSKEEQSFWLVVIALITLLVLIQWATYPPSYWRTKPVLAVLSPLIIVTTTLLSKAILDLADRLQLGARPGVMVALKTLVALLVVVLALVYYETASRHAQLINISTDFSDQGSYLKMVKIAREMSFHYTGDHNRMPLYPFFQALFYHPGVNDQDLFTQGKQINIILSLFLLAGMFLIFLRKIPYVQSVLLLLIIAYSLYLFKAPYMQSEITFYFLAFLSFVLMARMILKPSSLLAIACGVVLGLSYLTKASIMPALAAFAGVYGIKIILDWPHTSKPDTMLDARRREAFWDASYLLMVLGFFFLTTYPYTRVMKQRFGSYFYNVNTSVYVWYDSYDQAIEDEHRYGFANQWPPQMPADEIPGPQKYFREHDLAQILDRVWVGFQRQIKNVWNQYSVTNYPVSYLVILSMAALLDLRNSRAAAKKFPYLLAFCILYFLGYLSALSWYGLIAGGRRFIFGLFIPFMFSMFIALNVLADRQSASIDKTKRIDLTKFVAVSHLVIAFTLGLNIWFIVTERMFFDRFGS